MDPRTKYRWAIVATAATTITLVGMVLVRFVFSDPATPLSPLAGLLVLTAANLVAARHARRQQP